MRGPGILKRDQTWKSFEKEPVRKPRLQASSSPIVRIRKWSIPREQYPAPVTKYGQSKRVFKKRKKQTS